MLHILLLVFFVGAAQAHDTSQYDDAVKQVAALSLDQAQALNELQDHIYCNRHSFTLEERQQLIEQLNEAQAKLCSRPSAGIFSPLLIFVTLGLTLKTFYHYKNGNSFAETAKLNPYSFFLGTLNKDLANQEYLNCFSTALWSIGSVVAQLFMQAQYESNIDYLFAKQRKFEKQINYMIELLG